MRRWRFRLYKVTKTYPSHTWLSARKDACSYPGLDNGGGFGCSLSAASPLRQTLHERCRRSLSEVECVRRLGMIREGFGAVNMNWRPEYIA